MIRCSRATFETTARAGSARPTSVARRPEPELSIAERFDMLEICGHGASTWWYAIPVPALTSFSKENRMIKPMNAKCGFGVKESAGVGT